MSESITEGLDPRTIDCMEQIIDAPTTDEYNDIQTEFGDETYQKAMNIINDEADKTLKEKRATVISN